FSLYLLLLRKIGQECPDLLDPRLNPLSFLKGKKKITILVSKCHQAVSHSLVMNAAIKAHQVQVRIITRQLASHICSVCRDLDRINLFTEFIDTVIRLNKSAAQEHIKVLVRVIQHVERFSEISADL